MIIYHYHHDLFHSLIPSVRSSVQVWLTLFRLSPLEYLCSLGNSPRKPQKRNHGLMDNDLPGDENATFFHL
jgi:hypothetical protein